jgi:hypothetical protein
MINDKMIAKLAKTISAVDMEKLEDLSISQDSDGSYHLYNKYRITRNNEMYHVELHRIADKKVFNVLKNAVAWCSFDKRNNIQDSDRIVYLDNRLAGIEVEIQVHQKLVKHTKKTEEKLIYLAKLGEEKMERKMINEELSKYILNSRNWQERRLSSKSSISSYK